ncbi:PH domain-containing protein [Streptomyces sp. ST2-7A]|uniref:PH domain-containing protein n=1 Tax=Streptomyces sp. ST2-7A TaxID=2907214 RepID=UPI001F1B299E|nr:PH domain-containing protein [Streptomyces sp. ST2-7A]MCE7081035.1 PH domain-containing protein [Streptomyces sp. ST2-7A]
MNEPVTVPDGSTGGSGAPMVLRPPHHRVLRRAVPWWILRSLAGFLPLIGGATLLYALWEGGRVWSGPLLIGLVVLCLLRTAVVPSWRYAVHRWEIAEEAVYAASGWFVREWRIAPISRIQTVDTSRGPLEQLMGLSTLVVTTASSSGAVRIPGLDPEVAREAADRLTEITRRTPGDAT